MSIKPITKEYKTIEEFLKFRNIDCLTDIQELKESKNIIILGNFDGIHKGHGKIFEEAVKKAQNKGYKTVIYTFSEYPSKKENRITTSSEKLELINNFDIDSAKIGRASCRERV